MFSNPKHTTVNKSYNKTTVEDDEVLYYHSSTSYIGNFTSNGTT